MARFFKLTAFPVILPFWIGFVIFVRYKMASMNKLMGVVILYHPDTTSFLENLSSYLSELDQVLLLDNSETPSQVLIEALANVHSSKINYQYFGENRGIAQRLNQAIEMAKGLGYQYLLTMDQDTSFQTDQLAFYWRKIQENTLDRVVQFGANCQSEITPVNPMPQLVNNLITSGTILDLFYLDQIGPFDENLFIDFVDTEFSFRVIEKGYKNVLFSDIVLQHRIGYLKMGRSFKNLKTSARILHAPIRIYYILRNGLYLLFRSPYVKGANRKLLLSNMKILKNNLIYHPQLLLVYRHMFSAIYDFLMQRMGKKRISK